jgi:Promethin
MTLTVAIFSIVAALLVGLLGALLFIVFAIGVALCFLLPTLFFTTMVATFLFLWGLGGYYILKWFNEKRIPGIHMGFVEGIKGEFMSGETSENQQLDALNPDGSKASEHGEDKQEKGVNGEAANGTTKEEKHGQLPIEAPGTEQLDSARTTATEGLGNVTNAAKSREIPKLGTKSLGLG